MNGTYPTGTFTIASNLTASGTIGWSVRGQQYNGTTGPYVASGTVQLNGGRESTPTLSGWPLWQIFLSPVGEPQNLMAVDGIPLSEDEPVEIQIVQTQSP